jgi:hypothetical protein
MAPRPPMQIMIETAEYDSSRRSWRQALFTPDGDPIDLSALGGEGPPGPEGAQGPPGPQGSPGPQGATGATGATGPAGAAGSAGSQGAKGDKGDTGDTGPAGADGATTLAALTDVDETGLANGQGLIYNSTSGKWEAATLPGASVDSWQAMDSYDSHWAEYSTVPARVRKDSLGKVTLHGGAAVAGLFSWGVRVCTLPAGYRPAAMMEVLLPYFEITGGSRCIIWTEINTDGTIVPQGNPVGSVSGANGSRLLFDNVQFYT